MCVYDQDARTNNKDIQNHTEMYVHIYIYTRTITYIYIYTHPYLYAYSSREPGMIFGYSLFKFWLVETVETPIAAD